ncbi:TIGR03621 family F420-dependent LLM class oxidoreductase [Nakamurella lactea]|uniref:TIGR03621 family F420-dependent LLM class oxidoreductase n=1 Tax=Nakamurella lactea TaxID=459515 RepID=UPI0004212569|nr:TIGR03621 family F420-dependent LLM class oxidoreductase [Nakamurella lactea]
MREFEFLADVSGVVSGDELAARARHAEQLGYHCLVLPDHLLGGMSPVVTMAMVAAATSTLRVSAFVLNNDLRHPAVLAQELASIDVLSGGRLDIAIGAGWNEAEYDAIGLTFDRAPVRQARLAESITVLKGLFSGAPFSFAGEHYAITDYTAGPVPVQRPHPPFFIGGGGRRTLSLAGREADIVGLSPRILPGGTVDARSLTLAAAREKISWVREAAGARFDALRINIYPSMWPVTVTDDLRGEARRVIDGLRSRTGVELTEQEVIDSPHLFIGSIDRLVEKFLQLREELGISSVLLGGVDQLAPVLERLRG